MAGEQLHLQGDVDIQLIDKATGHVDVHIHRHNQLTEAFARWIMNGNLATHNLNVSVLSATDTATNVGFDTNPISQMLYSCPFLRPIHPLRPANAYDTAKNLNTNLKEGYQITRAGCSTGAYCLYVLTEPVNVTPLAVFPPYLNASLQELNRSIISLHGTESTVDDTSGVMERFDEQSYWSQIGENPGYTVSFTKSNGSAVIRSLVIGAIPSSVPACIQVWQSPSELPDGWDTAWETVWDTLPASTTDNTLWDSFARTLQTNRENGIYIIAPFLRTTYINGRWCDGLYTIGTTGTQINFYDLGVHSVEDNCPRVGSSDTQPGPSEDDQSVPIDVPARVCSPENQRRNMFTSETYCTVAEYFVNSLIAGGFDVGNGHCIRVNKGAAVFDGEKCVGRKVVIHFQNTLSQTAGEASAPPTSAVILDPIYATDDNEIPETIYKYNAPVMVARRDPNSEYNDAIEIFISMGVGQFTEYTDENGFHPGGTGIEIHKYTLSAYLYKWTAASLDTVLVENPDLLKYHGRVAVLPYAIGQPSSQPNEFADVSTTGVEYLTGGYDCVMDNYYLPITHILQGCTPRTWTFDPTANNAMYLHKAFSDTFIPGVVLEGIDYMFITEYLAGYNGSRVGFLTTRDGFTPTELNRYQWWSIASSMFLSAMTLDEPITKADTQRLVISYTYSLQVSPENPGAPDLAVSIASPYQVLLTWTQCSKAHILQIQRATSPQFDDCVPINTTYPTIAPGIQISRHDTGLQPNTPYYYRIRLWDGAVFSPYKYATILTPSL